ncbi:MAG: hypothetical protein QXT99_10130 [Candidatus Nitrosotenuis sp.]
MIINYEYKNTRMGNILQHKRFLLVLFISGLILRLIGIPVGRVGDVDIILLCFGRCVFSHGLSEGYAACGFKVYGPFSYALAGFSLWLSQYFHSPVFFYFVGGTSLLLGIRYIQWKEGKLIWFGIGILSVIIPLTLYFWPHWKWLYRYIVDFSSVNDLCPSCTGIWRATEIDLAILQGLAHPSRDKGPFIDQTIYRILDTTVLICILLLLVWFALRIKPGILNDKRKSVLADANALLLVMAFTSLIIPQLATRAHVNHTHAAMVLLIPFAIGNRRIIHAMLGMSFINLYFLLTEYPPRLGPILFKVPDTISTITIPDYSF